MVGDVLVRSPVRLVLGLVLAGWAAMPAWAAAADVSAIPLPAPSTQTLAPGVTYQRDVLAGGQVVHIIRIAPDGLATIDPVVVSGAVGEAWRPRACDARARPRRRRSERQRRLLQLRSGLPERADDHP